MKKTVIVLLVLLIAASCKQKIIKETTSIKEFDRQYYFGFEEKAFTDSNLTIPDSVRIYNDRLGIKLLHRYFVSDSSMCFKNDDCVFIKAQYDVQESKGSFFLIKLNSNNDFEYKFRYSNMIPTCGTCSPNQTLIGKRLTLNKKKYEVNDTVKGKLLLKYYVDHYCTSDSSERFKIEVDSILFKYRLYPSTKNAIVDFENDFNK